MKKQQKFVSAVCLSMFLTGINAQEALLTSGQEGSGIGGSSSSSIGQVLYTTNIGSSGSVAQGVQQAYEISTTNGIEETSIQLFCSAYPNPTVDNLILTVQNQVNSNLSYQLFDLNGKLIERSPVLEESTTINMASLPPAGYFLKVIQDAKEIKTFKIIKN